MRKRTLAMAILVIMLTATAVLAAVQGPRKAINPTDGSMLVWIPAGTFKMGSTNGDPDETPVTSVRVEGFWLGAYEVTNKQYAKFMEATKASPPDLWDDPAFNQPDQPVVAVRFGEVLAYCRWAGLRLPTEAEWEYASAAGSRQFAYGTATGQLTHDLANFGGTGGKDTYDDVPAPVGKFPPNPFGVYDLAGNAWEWTSSMWKPYPYDASDGREDLDQSTFRVMRGGCWHFGAFECRTSCRHRQRDHLHYDYVGFRVAKSEGAESAHKVTPEDQALVESVRAIYGRLNDSSLTAEQKRQAETTLNQLANEIKKALAIP